MNCKICSSETERIENYKKNIIYYSCINCDFIFIDEKKINTREDEKERYLKHNNSLDNEPYVDMFKDLIDKNIINNKDKIKSILDFGCGSVPVFVKLLKDKGFVVDKYDKYFFPAKDPLKKKYDLITLIEVIEHLKNPLNELDNLRKNLNINGFFLIKTLFHPEDKELFLKWWYKEDFTHISFFSAKTFKILANLLKMKPLIINNKDLCLLQKI